MFDCAILTLAEWDHGRESRGSPYPFAAHLSVCKSAYSRRPLEATLVGLVHIEYMDRRTDIGTRLWQGSNLPVSYQFSFRTIVWCCSRRARKSPLSTFSWANLFKIKHFIRKTNILELVEYRYYLEKYKRGPVFNFDPIR